MTTNNPNWRIKVNNHPELSDLRIYHFEDESDVENFAIGMLCEGITEFSLYHKDGGEWVEKDCNPYDFFTTIDDTPFPLAHGQLLPNLSEDVSPEIIWSLAQGNKDALSSIDNEPVREKAERIFQHLTLSGAWDESESLSQEGCGEMFGDDAPWKLTSEADGIPGIECISNTEGISGIECIPSTDGIHGIECISNTEGISGTKYILDTDGISGIAINTLSLDAEIDEEFADEFSLDELI